MFPSLRTVKSDRSLRKLKKGKGNFSWSGKSSKGQPVKPEVDFAAFHSGLPLDDHVPLQTTTSVRRPRRISTRTCKRDTILIDLTNDLVPALDYAFAILDADAASTHSLPPPPLKMPALFRGSSSDSADMPYTPSTSTFSPTSSVNPSVRSAPPRYVYVSSPLSSSSASSATPSARPSPQKRSVNPVPLSSVAPFDPNELSRALAHAQATNIPEHPSPLADSPPAVPFPPPAAPPAERIPLLQRKPRLLHSAESSMDGHESFVCRSLPSSSKVSLVRSTSSLDHHRDVFGSRGACYSTASLHTVDSTLSSLLAGQPASRTSYGSLKLFPSPKKNRTPARRASTPPPSRARLGIPSALPPVPALPDVFLIGPAARREAFAASTSLLSRSCR